MIRKNDVVQVVSGAEAEAGKRGKVLRVIPERGLVVVEGIRQVYKHVRPNRQKGIPGGRIRKDMPISVSAVMLYCDTCQRPRRCRARRTEEGKKIRVCSRCGNGIGAEG